MFIGGGYISFEFAHVAPRADTRATIPHRGGRPLDRFDPDLVDRLVGRTRELGVDVQVEAEVKSIVADSTKFKVRAVARGGEREFEADLVVHGAGRVPEVDDMHLAEAGSNGTLVAESGQRIFNTVRNGSKKADIIRLMERAKGATLEELMEATGWQAHSVRGFISGTLGKKLKMKIDSFRTDKGARTYRVKG